MKFISASFLISNHFWIKDRCFGVVVAALAKYTYQGRWWMSTPINRHGNDDWQWRLKWCFICASLCVKNFTETAMWVKQTSSVRRKYADFLKLFYENKHFASNFCSYMYLYAFLLHFVVCHISHTCWTDGIRVGDRELVRYSDSNTRLLCSANHLCS